MVIIWSIRNAQGMELLGSSALNQRRRTRAPAARPVAARTPSNALDACTSGTNHDGLENFRMFARGALLRGGKNPNRVYRHMVKELVANPITQTAYIHIYIYKREREREIIIYIRSLCCRIW